MSEREAARGDAMNLFSAVAAPAVDVPVRRPTAAAQTSLLAATGLVKRFGQTEALRGVELSIASGEVLAIMGPSGSGKSTLLHCLAGIIRPDEGTIMYGGKEMAAMSDRTPSALRPTEVGFVFQFGQLVPELTCLDNVALPLRLAKVKRAKA